jgi:hypothetical protein
MEDERKFLAEWITHFLKSRDMIFRTLESIDRHEQYDLRVKHKNKEQFVIAEPIFRAEILGKLKQDKHFILIGFHTEENFQFILANWKQLASFPNLTIYTINPLSEPDKKWVISPYVHQRICDAASLKAGLRAMYETVIPLSQEKIKSLIKQKE